MRNAMRWMFVVWLVAAFFVGCKDRGDAVVVAVNQYVHHPNLAATLDGFKEVVDEWAKAKGVEVEYKVQVANGNTTVATQIARQQAGQKPNLILALATPSAQAAAKATKSIPIVFGAITDPVEAGLVESLVEPGGNVTGSSDQWPYDKQFELMRRLRSEAKVIGIVLNPGEANTVASMKRIDPALAKFGFSKVEAAVSNTSEVLMAAQSLVGRVDLFFAPADNTVLSGLDAFAKVARINKIPLFVGDEGSVKKGGVATYGVDYKELGRQTGELAVRILEGGEASAIPVVVGSGAHLLVNPAAAREQGLELPEDVLREAAVVE